jgi:sugar phosphate isomerase/epimerase
LPTCCCDYGLQLAYHHHLMMLVEHDDELERFLSQTHDNVGLAFDTGHAFVAGVEIPRAGKIWSPYPPSASERRPSAGAGASYRKT